VTWRLISFHPQSRTHLLYKCISILHVMHVTWWQPSNTSRKHFVNSENDIIQHAALIVNILHRNYKVSTLGATIWQFQVFVHHGSRGCTSTCTHVTCLFAHLRAPTWRSCLHSYVHLQTWRACLHIYVHPRDVLAGTSTCTHVTCLAYL